MHNFQISGAIGKFASIYRLQDYSINLLMSEQRIKYKLVIVWLDGCKTYFDDVQGLESKVYFRAPWLSYILNLKKYP